MTRIMMDIIKNELNRKTVFLDESKLSLDYIPERLLHREEAQKQVTQIFLPLLKTGTFLSRNVLITGNNGSGKTALAKSFGRAFEDISSDFKKKIKYVHVNCRINKSNYAIVKNIIKRFQADFPEKGFSLYELVSFLKRLIDQDNIQLIIALDEMNFLDFSSDNLLYMLTRLNDAELNRDNRVSVIGIEKNLNFIKNFDLSTVSSFQYNVIHLSPYSAEQLFDILDFRSKLAFKPGCCTAEIIDFIAHVSARYSDMRYAMEILYKAGKNADQKGLDSITPECVRFAQECTLENIDSYSIQTLSIGEKLVLLATCRVLRSKRSTSVDLESLKQQYQILCEEIGLQEWKKTQFYSTISRLKLLQLIAVEAPSPRKKGVFSTVRIDNLPLEILEDEVLKSLTNVPGGSH